MQNMSCGFAAANKGSFKQALKQFRAAVRRAEASSDDRLLEAALTGDPLARLGGPARSSLLYHRIPECATARPDAGDGFSPTCRSALAP